MNINPDIGIKISTALLKYKGEITEEEIKAIPFIDEIEANFIINEIIENFNVEVIIKQTRDKPFLEWSKILRLKNE
jgi:hypothetical protein